MPPDETTEFTVEDIESMLYSLRAQFPEKTELRAVERLMFIRLLMLGYDLKESCRIIDVSLPTGYTWRDAWEKDGLAFVFPNYGGGRRYALNPDEMAEACDRIATERMTTAEAREYIRKTYDVDYSAKQVAVRLKSLGLRHVRPYELEFDSEEEESSMLRSSSAMRWTRRCSIYGVLTGLLLKKIGSICLL